MIKVFFSLILFFSLTSCGIEVAQGIPKLNAPGAVVVSHGGSAGIDVCWWGLNPEDDFSGYNIYYTDNSNNAVAGLGTKIANRSGDPDRPTIEFSSPFFSSAPFGFRITQSEYPEIISEYAVLEIYIYITAYSTIRDIESTRSVPARGTPP